MTLKVTITHDEADSHRDIRARVNGVNVSGYEPPWTTIPPGEAATFHVYHGVRLEVLEGDVVERPQPELVEVEGPVVEQATVAGADAGAPAVEPAKPAGRRGKKAAEGKAAS